jgi:ribosomal protein L44E
MAEEKKGFILYSDIIHTIEKLTDEQAGVLFKHILKYVNDENPECKDLITEIAFEPIKQSLKRDLLKWGDKKQKRSEAGIAGATKRWQNIAKDSKRIKPIANIAVNVNDNVSVINIYRRFANLILTNDEFNKLLEKYSKQQIDSILNDIENYKGNTKYKSLYLTAKKWLQKNEPTSEGISPEELKARKYGLIK